MRLFTILVLTLVTAVLPADSTSSIYQFSPLDIDGKPRPLSLFEGQVLLIVNVASKCAYTYQYEGLQTLHERYGSRGLLILGFPANDFYGQEPGTNAEIKSFCTTHYGVSFPMFGKITVQGDDQHPLYDYLTSRSTNPRFGGPITWNFNKFLIGRDGAIVGRFDTGVDPLSSDLIGAVEAALGPASLSR